MQSQAWKTSKLETNFATGKVYQWQREKSPASLEVAKCIPSSKIPQARPSDGLCFPATCTPSVQRVAFLAEKPGRTAAQCFGIPLRRLTKPTNRCIFESGVALKPVSD